GTSARIKGETAQIAGKGDESRRYFAAAQKQTADALQMLDKLLEGFGTAHDYVVSRNSIYERLLPASLILAGQLTSDQNKWDKAARYFEVAIPFNRVRERAVVSAAEAYQRCNQPEKAVALLGAAAQDRNNLLMVYAYTQTLFRYQMSRNDGETRALDQVESNLNYLNEHRAELPASLPAWAVDIQLVRFKLAKASVTNVPEKILQAQITATKEFRDLENKEFPPPKNAQTSERKVYSDDLGFLTELAGVYSSLAALSDFDRILARMRELPGGENAYFRQRLNDALGRNDKEGATHVIEEAIKSNALSSEQKQQFLTIMQNLKNEQPTSLDNVYATLKENYDKNPDALKPQAFFLMANMAVDRNDLNYAKILQGRLEKIEGAPEHGTWWRYIESRILLSEQVPQYDRCRQLQEEIIKLRPDWDMAYALRASIEEKFFMANPDNEDAKAKIIESLQAAIRCGNKQPAIWNRLLSLYEADNRTEEAKKLRTSAMVRAIALDDSSSGQFPQPYQRMYAQVFKHIQDNDPQNADTTAKQCIALAEGRREDPNLIFALNLALGKMFFDAEILEPAKWHLSYVAKRGSSYVFPLAVCIAKNKQVDEGFNLLLDEMDRTPSSQPILLPSVLVLLAQVRPSEAVFNRIDKLMLRIENGERQTLRGNIEEPEKDGVFVPLGIKRLRSLVIRFPDDGQVPPADGFEIFPPDEEDTKPVPAAGTGQTPEPEVK
ncbi:MAG: hypothetical protein LBN39_06395, partial [Planctomycetaceae bacterium]|nr:hypothetical protein [Planctomycetaceae bacterium]